MPSPAKTSRRRRQPEPPPVDPDAMAKRFAAEPRCVLTFRQMDAMREVCRRYLAMLNRPNLFEDQP